MIVMIVAVLLVEIVYADKKITHYGKINNFLVSLRIYKINENQYLVFTVIVYKPGSKQL